MNQLKKLIGLIVILSMTLLVVSCGTSEKSPQSSQVSGTVTGNGKSEPVKKKVKVEAPEEAVETVTVTDIAKHPAQKEIAKLIEEGAVTIGADGKFNPNKIITRGEFIQWIYNFDNKGINPHEPNVPSFSDVGKESPYFTTIEGLKAAGLIVGFPDGTFKPEKQLTREELTLLWGWYRENTQVTNPAVGLAGGGLMMIKDANKVGQVYRESVNEYKGLLTKVFRSETMLMPQQEVTRAEAAKWIIVASSEK